MSTQNKAPVTDQTKKKKTSADRIREAKEREANALAAAGRLAKAFGIPTGYERKA